MAGAYILDLTRSVSRIGRGALTGIDRVEAAYLHQFLAQDDPLFGLVRTRFGYLLLGRAGCVAASDLLQGRRSPEKVWYRTWTRAPFRADAEAVLRKLAIGRALPRRLGKLLRAVPPHATYFNVGHSNLTAKGLAALREAGMGIVVMIHDTIPLDHPSLARPGVPLQFAAKLAAVARFAGHVIHLTQVSRHQTEAHFTRLGRCPPGITAQLGTEIAPPLPADFLPKTPYFVALGTIEPRKNLALLLDVWQGLGDGGDVPHLVILGRRGWERAEVLAQLDRAVAGGHVTAFENIPDGAVMTALAGAAALVHPSLAEGFGLTPVEAAAVGCPIIATDLAVTREVMGDLPVYLNGSDSYSWLETIRAFAVGQHPAQNQRENLAPPTWDAHFKTVLTALR